MTEQDSQAVLTPGQTSALRDLAHKAAGKTVGWINISDAMTLTTSGLAERGRVGWRITQAGMAILDPDMRGQVERFSKSGARRPSQIKQMKPVRPRLRLVEPEG